MKSKWILTLGLCIGLVLTINLNALSLQEKDVDPVNWRDLIPFLIDVPGFEKDGDPDGQTMSMMNMKWTTVSQRYEAEGGNKDLTIEIIDSAKVSAALQGVKAMMGMEVDSSEEYVKQIEIKGFPAVESYQYDDKSAQVMILLSDRFLVRLEGDEYEDTSQLKNISKKIDLQGIANLAK